jgi:hypothetical protein
MTQHYDETPADVAEPTLMGEDAALARRLERDGAAWRAQVPPNDRLNARVRALPSEQPRRTHPEGARRHVSTVERTFDENSSSMRTPEGLIQGPTRPTGSWAAEAAALVVVGLIAALLLGSRVVHQLQPGGLGSAPTTPTPTPAKLATPTTQAYSPAAKYITSAITAGGVDPADQPIEPTSQFTRNQAVYVIVQMKNAPAGQHTLTIRWYVSGKAVSVPSNVNTSISVPGPNATVFFKCMYAVYGKGTAKLYWDLPPNTPDDQAGTWLVRDVAFVVAPLSVPATPTVKPGGAITPTLTPMPGSMGG